MGTKIFVNTLLGLSRIINGTMRLYIATVLRHKCFVMTSMINHSTLNYAWIKCKNKLYEEIETTNPWVIFFTGRLETTNYSAKLAYQRGHCEISQESGS